MEYVGELGWWFETGTEGTYWILHESGKKGYGGMVLLENGDQLTIYNEDGTVKLECVIDKDTKTGWREYPLRPGSGVGQPCALGLWVHWTQRGWNPDDWARLFIPKKGEKHLRAKVMR